MTLALPGGYVDVGTRLTVSMSCGVQINVMSDQNDQDTVTIGSYTIGNIGAGKHDPACAPPGSSLGYHYYFAARIQGPGVVETDYYDGPPYATSVIGHWYLSEIRDFGCLSPTNPEPFQYWSQVYAYSRVVGPFRLGVIYMTPPGVQTPLYAQGCTVKYAWFADPDTTSLECFGSIAPQNTYYVTGGHVGVDPVPTTVTGPYSNLPSLSSSASFHGSLADGVYVKWTDISVNSAIDTSLLSTNNLVGVGTAGINLVQGASAIGATVTGSWSVALPFEWTTNTHCRLNSTDAAGAEAGALININDGGITTTNPQGTGLVHTLLPQASWLPHWGYSGGPISVALDGGWMAGYDPPLPAADGTMLLLMPAPRLGAPLYDAPGGVPSGNPMPASYSPVSLAIMQGLNINRPDGNSPPTIPSWIATGGIAVDEQPAFTRLTVTTLDSSVTRTLKTNAANYIDMALDISNNFTNPNAGIDYYEVTKHNWYHDYQTSNTGNAQTVYPEDIWGWNTFSWLRVSLSVPADGDLTLTVNYTSLAVEDNHLTGSDRPQGMEFTPTPGVCTYTIPAVRAQTDYDIDLVSPAEGAPHHPDRVTSVSLSGFLPGEYRINSMVLLQKSPEYVKVGFGVPRRRLTADQIQALIDAGQPVPPAPDWSAPVVAVDGTQVFGCVPDQANKGDELGNTGGSLRYCDPVTGASSGIIGDFQYTLKDFWALLNRIEGLAAIYDPAAATAALQDLQGNRAGPEMAQWLRNVLPYQRGGALQCYMACGSVQICAGIKFLVYGEHSIAGGFEAFGIQGGKRAAPGLTATARREDTGAAVATGTTDDQGYCVLTPIPANEILLDKMDGQVLDAKLRPRELVRFYPVFAPDGSQVTNAVSIVPRGRTGWGRRFEAVNGSINQVEYYDCKALPAGSPSELKTNNMASGSWPSGERDEGGTWHLWYCRSGNIYYRSDRGTGWSAEQLAISGYTAAATVYCPVLHRVIMAAVSTGGRLKILQLNQATANATILTVDSSIPVVDVATADAAKPDLEILADGMLQVGWFQGGVYVSRVSRDAVTWTAS